MGVTMKTKEEIEKKLTQLMDLRFEIDTEREREANYNIVSALEWVLQ